MVRRMCSRKRWKLALDSYTVTGATLENYLAMPQTTKENKLRDVAK
jgi:hypothetical protein